MEQPEGLQQELLKMNREARTWVLDIVNQIANARAAHEDLENGTIVRVADLEQQLHAAGDGDTWREACKRVEAELSTVAGQLEEARAALAELRKQLPRILDAPRNDEADRVWMAWSLRLKAVKAGGGE